MVNDEIVTRDSVDKILSAQSGIISTRQLKASGIGAGAIQSRAQAGRYRRIHSGVYFSGYGSLSLEQRCLAALLAAGEDAALTGLVGATLRSWWKRSKPERVTVVATRQRSIPGVELIRTRHWNRSQDIEWWNGLPFARGERTIIDLSTKLTRYQLTNVIKEAAFWGRFDASRFVAEAARLSRRSGLVTARRAVDSYLHGCAGTRSALEDRMVRLIDRADLPQPDEAGMPIGAHEVDLVWLDHQLIVEVDGPGHQQPNSRKKDPARDSDLHAAGFKVIRFTNDAIDHDPQNITKYLSRVLKS